MKDFVAIVGDTVRVTGSNVNVRSGAGTSYGSLYQLSSPTTATVKGMSNGWVKIKPASYSEGWMSATCLKKSSSGSGGSVYPGVTGSGHNSTVTAADIRANTGKYWKKDTSTYHPQIKKLQEKIWHYCYTHGLNFSEYRYQLVVDGFQVGGRIGLLLFITVGQQFILPGDDILCVDLADHSLSEVGQQLRPDHMLLGKPGVFLEARTHVSLIQFQESLESHIQIPGFFQLKGAFPFLRFPLGSKAALTFLLLFTLPVMVPDHHIPGSVVFILMR